MGSIEKTRHHLFCPKRVYNPEIPLHYILLYKGGRIVFSLRPADDIDLMAGSDIELQNLNNKLIERKLLFKLFKGLVSEIEVDINQNLVRYLDVELNLQNGSVSPYMKPNG